MTIKELEAKVKALEEEIVRLKAQPVVYEYHYHYNQQPYYQPYVPYPVITYLSNPNTIFNSSNVTC